MQTLSGSSLPRSLEPFMQPLHVGIEEEGDMEDIWTMGPDVDNKQSLGA